ncbi:hypothetical protein F5B22DRAFT_584662 [Xylaria bambusicola]|uniref:uncharacterized protein n=1 Tax=Xylaria bambusicola TaxID=326684 RepID=UPI0020079974|nr:uncharacterized protein F5B22DRAFT_584662 [Xylaria bambusicola]KAI0526158.1 hypothetical protein F5B22DRAFT_584662 [Xylaria bambusicola]
MYGQELVAWLNSLLQLDMTKVEQCGTGYTKNHHREPLHNFFSLPLPHHNSLAGTQAHEYFVSPTKYQYVARLLKQS